MPDYYATTDDVAQIARNLEVSYGKAATMTPSNVGQFLGFAQQIVNARLSHAYYTPLRKLTRTDGTYYPDPIPYITAKLAAALAVRSVYSRIEPALSQAADSHYNEAIQDLNRFTEGVLRGANSLDGQTPKARNFFVNPYIAPLESQGGGGGAGRPV